MQRIVVWVAAAVLAAVAMTTTTGCSATDWKLVHGNLAAGGLKLDQGLEWYTGVGDRLAADPASVPADQREQFTKMGAALRKISLGLNIILGNYELTAAGWVRKSQETTPAPGDAETEKGGGG